MDLYLCALQSAPSGTALRGLREDVLSPSKPRALATPWWRLEVGGTVRSEDERQRGPSVAAENRASDTVYFHILAWSAGLGVGGAFWW